MTILEEVREKWLELIQKRKIDAKTAAVHVTARTLTPEEAIGNPERLDYLLFLGKEVMIEAQFGDAKGHAFTDMPGNYEGTLQEVMELPLKNSFERAVFIACLNAFMKSLGLIKGSVHCRDDQPLKCALQLADYIRSHYGMVKVAFVGLQPGLIQALTEAGFEIRASDLNPDNVGKVKCGTTILPASTNRENAQWADVVIATGSTFVNDSYQEFSVGKPILYFGVTVSGIAEFFGLQRYCPCGN
ncbi:MAG: DUF364 domain-containing protein [Selenomonadaceae bacterium]